MQEEKQKMGLVFAQLFEAFLEDLNSGDESREIFRLHVSRLPNDYVQDTPFGRIAADYLAALTDRMLVQQYRQRFLPRAVQVHLTEPNG